MAECGFCIGSEGDGEYSEFHHEDRPKARKVHKCCECSREIMPGEHYQRIAGKFDGYMYGEKTCAECAEIRSALSCEVSPAYGSMWSEITDYIFPHINTACYDKLSTAPAKKYLQEKWMQWKGLAV